jgi:predicted membrane-bound mannosyltransferase
MKYDSQVDKSRVFLMLLISAGVGIRLLQFFYNRSIWYDEAKVTLHILMRSFTELHLPMPTATSAPFLFLYLIKFNTAIFGYNEYALRLLPLSCGVLTIILFFIPHFIATAL